MMRPLMEYSKPERDAWNRFELVTGLIVNPSYHESRVALAKARAMLKPSGKLVFDDRPLTTNHHLTRHFADYLTNLPWQSLFEGAAPTINDFEARYRQARRKRKDAMVGMMNVVMEARIFLSADDYAGFLKSIGMEADEVAELQALAARVTAVRTQETALRLLILALLDGKSNMSVTEVQEAVQTASQGETSPTDQVVEKLLQESCFFRYRSRRGVNVHGGGNATGAKSDLTPVLIDRDFFVPRLDHSTMGMVGVTTPLQNQALID